MEGGEGWGKLRACERKCVEMSAFFLFHMSHENFTVNMTVTCDFSEKCEILREILMRKRKRSEMGCFSEKSRTLRLTHV